jgi:Septum formation
VICAECKREIPATSQSCPACGAPVNSPTWVKVGPPTGLADGAVKEYPSSSGSACHTSSPAPRWEGRAAANNSRRALLIVAVVVLGALAAMVLGIWLAYSSWQHRPWTHHLTFTQLRPGDCLAGSNLGLGSGSAWPYTVSAVPCTQPHLAEITFAGNLWPTSLATFPGVDAVTNIVDNRCQSALYTYAGESQPSLLYDSIAPGNARDWAAGNRLVVCMAYEKGISLRRSVKAKGR